MRGQPEAELVLDTVVVIERPDAIALRSAVITRPGR